MKRTTLYLCLSLITISQYAQDYNVLFIGNSYTYVNDLPLMLSQIAQSKSNSIITASSTPGAYSLESHTENATTQELLQNGSWDYVILQEQSQMPAFPINQVEADVYPYAQALVDTARANNDCVMPIFYMTWGRMDGDINNCESYPPVCTYEGMQDLLTERYQAMAEMNDCWVSPVGAAWKQVRAETNDEIQLYANDGSHPSPSGTYLAACVFYAMMWNESPEGSDYYAGLDEADAQYLQAVAGSVVANNQEAWNHFPNVAAQLDISQGLPPFYSVQTDLSYWADSVLVNFGDQEYLWLDGAINALLFEDGTLTYDMEIYSSCGTVVVVEMIEIGDLIGVSEDQIESVKAFPNPTTDWIEIEGLSTKFSYRLYTVSGDMVEENKDANISIATSHLAKGRYIAVLEHSEGMAITSFIKQ
ncbi:MAG: hypothetical protein ACI84C_001049 [Flavobacteriales bacterium]|jgi:hypothetical protein